MLGKPIRRGKRLRAEGATTYESAHEVTEANYHVRCGVRNQRNTKSRDERFGETKGCWFYRAGQDQRGENRRGAKSMKSVSETTGAAEEVSGGKRRTKDVRAHTRTHHRRWNQGWLLFFSLSKLNKAPAVGRRKHASATTKLLFIPRALLLKIKLIKGLRRIKIALISLYFDLVHLLTTPPVDNVQT